MKCIVKKKIRLSINMRIPHWISSPVSICRFKDYVCCQNKQTISFTANTYPQAFLVETEKRSLTGWYCTSKMCMNATSSFCRTLMTNILSYDSYNFVLFLLESIDIGCNFVKDLCSKIKI